MTPGEILPDLIRVYQGSDGSATQALHGRLEELGAVGLIAAHLLRAQKASDRAKVYRGGDRRGSFRGQAYDRKGWAIGELCKALAAGSTINMGWQFTWGWGRDEKNEHISHVLYVDLPTGQVSFHAPGRGEGPDYQNAWDGVPGQSADRILRWCARLIAAQAVPA